MTELSRTVSSLCNLVRPEATYRGSLCLARPPEAALRDGHARFLHREEILHFSRLKFPLRQTSYLVGRYCAKQALLRMEAISDPKSVAIVPGVFDQPVVHGVMRCKAQVSISHAGHWGAALAFPEAHPMAIDIEQANPAQAEPIRSQLTPAELRLRHPLPIREMELLTVLWTAKEALAKVTRCGMMTPFSVFEVATLKLEKGALLSTFSNFAQYKALSFAFSGVIATIVIPKRTELELDLEGVSKRLLEVAGPPFAA